MGSFPHESGPSKRQLGPKWTEMGPKAPIFAKKRGQLGFAKVNLPLAAKDRVCYVGRVMRRALLILLAASLATLLLLPTQAAERSPDTQRKGVVTQTYRGWDECLIMEASGVKAIVAPAIGGRIVHYSVGGENIIFENPASFGKTLGNTQTNFWVGGYQCDIGPELRGIPDHEALWMGLYKWHLPRDFAVQVTSERDQNVGVQIEKEILIEPGSGDLGITQTMRNVSNKEVAYCLWDRTLCKNDGFAFFPLNKRSRFKAGWSLRRTVAGKYVYDGTSPGAPNVKILKNILVARCEGPPTKVGADSDAGWIAYVLGRMLFVKYFPYMPEGNYSDGGNSVELYFDERVAELEPLSPEVTLRPNETYSFPEKWTLIELKEEVLTFEQVRAVVKQIPASPFKR